MFSQKRPYYIILICFFLTNCSDFKKTKESTVATVGDKKLLISDVAQVIPDELSRNDSIVLAEDYIRKWIKQELLLQKAEENLAAEQKNVQAELMNYRNSLIIYRYKNILMTQRMDTLVTDDQIEGYYLANPENFNLSSEIVKAIFIKVPVDTPGKEKLKQYCADSSEEGIKKLRDSFQLYSKNLDIFLDKWIDFEIIRRNIPKGIGDAEDFLRNNNFYELTYQNDYYLVYIKDYKLKTELAPLDFVKEKIKNLILNQRKVEFLKQIEENIYTEGIRKKKFKIYNLETDDKK